MCRQSGKSTLGNLPWLRTWYVSANPWVFAWTVGGARISIYFLWRQLTYQVCRRQVTLNSTKILFHLSTVLITIAIFSIFVWTIPERQSVTFWHLICLFPLWRFGIIGVSWMSKVPHCKYYMNIVVVILIINKPFFFLQEGSFAMHQLIFINCFS